MAFVLHGIGTSSGIAIGKALLIAHAILEVQQENIAPKQVDAEVARFDEALKTVQKELKDLKQNANSISSEMSALLGVYMLFLKDPEIAQVPRQIIREKRCNAEWALVQQMKLLVGQFDHLDDPYLKERKYDVVQLVERVVKALSGEEFNPFMQTSNKANDVIVVAHDLSPADAIHFKEQRFAGFITDVGGATSHTAILSRSMMIPAVLGLKNAKSLIAPGQTLIVDGLRASVIVNPTKEILAEYKVRKRQLELRYSYLKRLKSTRTQTLDGMEVSLLANIELPNDVQNAEDSGAQGIGLFRSEFLFLNRGDMPSEDEQFQAYRQVVEKMEGLPVTIRTFDLGADKIPNVENYVSKRINPALGRRAIRMSLFYPNMFQVQLRALLRASHFGVVRILLPMLSTALEIEQALNAIEQAKESLRQKNIPFDESIAIGGMIEVPAAALTIDLFLKRLDFLSIGTNDLIQYTLAVDRSDEEVSSLYDPLHPAVLTLIYKSIQSAEKADIPISICGEMAGDTFLTRFLLGLGLRHFSMHPAQILKVKELICRSNVAEITQMVKKLLRLDDSAKVREGIAKINALYEK